MNKNVFLLFSILLVLNFKSFCQTPSERHNTKPIGTTEAPFGYHEYLPTGYDAGAPNSLPLVIFLHGIGEMGNGTEADLDTVLTHGPPKLVENDSKDFPFILLSPQTSKEWYYVTPTLNDFVQYAKANYKVDPNRIYITGLSMGGSGTWYYAADYPEEVAAIIPICGPGQFWQPCKYKNMGIWAFHNAHDTRITVDKSITMVDTIKSCGGNPYLTIYDSDNHDAWSRTYNNDKVWEWLLAQKKGVSVPPDNKFPTVTAGSDIVVNLPNDSTLIAVSASDPEGKLGNYFWKKLAGPPVTMSYLDSSTIKLSKLVEGEYKFRIIVTDSRNASAHDDINVVVKGPNCADKDLSPTIVPSLASPSCEGDTLVLTIAEDYDQYLWSTGETTKSIKVTNRGYYSFSGSFANGCTSSNPGYEAIYIPKPKTPALSIGDTTAIDATEDTLGICEGEKIVLSAPTGYAKYTWSNGATAREIEVEAGAYFLTAANTNGCERISDTVIVTQYKIPETPTIIYDGIDSLTSSVIADNYHWFLNGEPLKVNSRSIRGRNFGEAYTLSVDNHGCFSALSPTLTPLSDENELGSSQKIFPNPSNGNFYIEISPKPISEIIISVMDLSGKTIKSEKYRPGELNSAQEINAHSLPDGLYLIKIQEGDRVTIERVVKNAQD